MITRRTRPGVAHESKRRQGLAGAWALAALLLACGAPEPERVLLVSIDSLRADRLGAYGYERDTSPRIDALAREGTLFERTVSSTSWTLPAHAALFTGLDDARHGVQTPKLALGSGVPTLAQALADAGFATAAIVSGPYLHPKFGLDRGFDDYLNCMSYLDDRFEPRPDGPEGLDRDGALNRASHADVTGPCVAGRAREWMAHHRDERWLLFVHLWDVHYDYRPPRRLAERFRRPGARPFDASHFASNPLIHPAMGRGRLAWLLGLYDAEVAYTDQSVGEILDALDDLDLSETTLVVLTSDHGDAFFEHGAKGHQRDLHAESVSIPLILRGPGVPAGVRRPGPAHITDLMPTILDLVGVAPPAGLDGRSLTRAFDDPEALADRWVFSELRLPARHQVALESLERKVMRNVYTGQTVAFDLERDPAERRAMAANGELSDRLDERIRALERGAGEIPRPEPVPDLAPELVERLRELGYVD